MPEPKQPGEVPGPAPSAGDGPPRLGDFEILERIGQGAVGAVFKARQRSMDRLVAVKVLIPRLAADAGYVERFWREARAAARLNHPNIVLAIDAGEDQGFCYFAMEHVEGHSVGLLLKAGPLEEQRALQIALQVARALDYAWSQERIVHRDIKPGNIIITPDGTAKLADMGLAQAPAFDEAEDALSADGKIVGTPFYIAPEQIQRRTDLDTRCDLYALGATLFHMLTGHAPYEDADPKAVLARHMRDPIPDPRTLRPEVHEGTARIVSRLLAKSRDDRYPDGKALVSDLEGILGASAPRPAAAPAIQTPPRVRRGPVRKPRSSSSQVLVLLAVVIVLIVAALALWRGAARGPDEAAEEPGELAGTATAPSGAPGAAEVAYRESEAFAQAHPGDHAAAIGRFRAVEMRFPGTAYAGLAAEYRTRLEVDLSRQAREALKSLRRRAELMIEQGRLADALALFGTVAKPLSTGGWRERVAVERKRLTQRARARFDAALGEAKAAAARGAFDEAIRRSEAVGTSAPAAWRSDVASLIEQIHREQAEAARRAEAEREGAHLRVVARVAALYRERSYDAAEQLIRGQLDAAQAPHRQELARELDEIAFLKGLWAQAERNAASRVGRAFVVRGIRGKLVAVKDGRLTIQSQGGRFVQELAKLSTEQALELARAHLPPAAEPSVAARFLVAEGRSGEATRRIDALEADGHDVAALRARLECFGAARFLLGARAELERIQKSLGDGDAAGLPALRAFIARYRDRPAAADLCARAQRLLAEAEQKAAKVPRFAAQLQIACDGRYRLFLNGDLLAEATTPEGKLDSVNLRVRRGDLLAVEATSAGDHRGLYARLDVQGGRYVVPTDASWLCHANPPAGWRVAPEAPGTWHAARAVYSPHVKPGYARTGKGLPGFWVWGSGERCCFRRVLELRTTAEKQAAAAKLHQRRTAARYGKPTMATLWVACRDAYRLFLNGEPVGVAASFIPEGASYRLALRHGDVLGVEASSHTREGWLDAQLTGDGFPEPVRTDRTWVCTQAPAPPEWAARGKPGGSWRAPDRVDDTTTRIWAAEPRLLFRKTIWLKPAAADAVDPLFHAAARLLPGRQVELTCDLRSVEQLADWHAEGDWAWRDAAVSGSRGGLYSVPFRMGTIEVAGTVDAGAALIVGLWGQDASRRTGITVSVNYPRPNEVALRCATATVGTGLAPASSTGVRRIVLRKKGTELSVAIDGRHVVSGRCPQQHEAGALSRVGFRAGGDTPVALRAIRITGEPEWDALRADARRTGGGPPAPRPSP